MKRIIPIAILLVALISAFVWYHNSSNTPKSESIAEIPAQVEQTILLYPLSGEVSFKVTPDAEFQNVTVSPTVIPNQAIVHTGIGKASVLLPDNSTISLENNTEITVNYSEKDISIYQSFGTTYHRVQKLITGSSYQVQTAGTLAAVRGTKFAVKYDLKTKKTKIAVTESKVQVSNIPKLVNGVKQKEESVLVEEGKTISVAMLEGGSGTGETPATSPSKQKTLEVIDTINDKEMKIFVEEQKKTDAELENIKKEFQDNDKVKIRNEIKRKLFDDTKENVLPKEVEKKTEEIIKTETRKVEDAPVVNKSVTPSSEIEKPLIDETNVITKIGEEEFFTAFEPLFIKYFYIDDADTLCDLKVTPDARVQVVTTFAKSKGYPFTSASLLSFAQEIDKYCIRKDESVKVKLQSRFDDEYPFQ